MENASKALIIAGAILLSILIISLGIMIYNQASGVIDNNAIDEVAVQTFNQKFTQYEGSKVKGATVNALLQAIVSNNLANTDDESKQVSIYLTGTGKYPFNSSNWSKVPSSNFENPLSLNDIGHALTGKAYDVETVADPQSGYIYQVTIKALN